MGVVDPVDLGLGFLANPVELAIPSSVEQFASATRSKNFEFKDRIFIKSQISTYMRDAIDSHRFDHSHEAMGFAPEVLDWMVQIGQTHGVPFPSKPAGNNAGGGPP